jgi:hypothetical protein
MNPKKIVVAATAFACVALLPVAGAQATVHPHHMHVVTHHHGHQGPVAAGADLAAGAIGTADAFAAAATAPFGAPGWQGGYYAPGGWGDYECRPTPADNFCRPYASKDWSKP